ncbi:Hypothetical predicted protein [Lecanosticta acicola]|uniref:Glycine zipper domain-containing protein n=1 Tax=Lecanosticta acicola TaxID=111012 RepID=A0AAI8Z146_9PEZI|nr:Hypothetical predicted protein [Lecanosticta acicola]
MSPQEQKSAKQPDRNQLLQAVAAQQEIAKAQSYASSLRDKASKIQDPQERERMVQEAYEKEIAVNGNSKFAQRLQSGPWQGAAAGGGIGLGTGLGVGAGVGTLAGTLVGGLVSIPTTALGALIGTGVGAIKGPFIKVGGKEKRWDEASPEEVVDALEEEQATGNEQARSGAQVGTEPLPSASAAAKRKPRKLEIRSKKDAEETAASGAATTSGQDMDGTTKAKKA